MPKRCVINVSCGGWYPKGHDRLKKSLQKHAPGVDLVSWVNQYPPDCPPHSSVPYAFKPYAFQAARARGYETVLWLDSAAWAIKPVIPVFEQIEEVGHLFQLNGWTNSDWCSDAALKTLGYTREEMKQVRHIMACIMGLNFHDLRSVRFLEAYLKLANDGVTFHGAWKNDRGQVSTDKSVLGHRHDQTAASALIHRMGLSTLKKPILHYQGAYEKNPKLKIPENVRFFSRGGVVNSF